MNEEYEFVVEFESSTYRNYTVTAKTADEAEELAEVALAADEEVSKAWKENAKVMDIECKKR
jgi:hypothetical protein